MLNSDHIWVNLGSCVKDKYDWEIVDILSFVKISITVIN